MTQEEFAKLLDVSFVTINRWETGKYVPTIKARRKLQPYSEKYNMRWMNNYGNTKIRINMDWKRKNIRD